MSSRSTRLFTPRARGRSQPDATTQPLLRDLEAHPERRGEGPARRASVTHTAAMAARPCLSAWMIDWRLARAHFAGLSPTRAVATEKYASATMAVTRDRSMPATHASPTDMRITAPASIGGAISRERTDARGPCHAASSMRRISAACSSTSAAPIALIRAAPSSSGNNRTNSAHASATGTPIARA